MSEIEPSKNTVPAEVFSNIANEVAKAVAMLYGVDPITSSAIGGFAAGVTKSLPLQLVERIARLRAARINTAVGEALKSGVDPEEFISLALNDDRKLELLARAMEAAQKTVEDQRVKFYGQIAAEGILAADAAIVDESQRILSTIASLEPSDLKIFLHMRTAENWSKYHHEGGSRTLAIELPELSPVLDSSLARLEALGLATSASEGGLSFGTFWRITKFGELCLKKLLNDYKKYDQSN
ncbi:hypothetical protein [Allokutzneria oryzae]|uniref:DUF4393 domain-containing protein n=1 Tax=Allokutzneria oryzae TaxID=1378989 RepID=A0ABV6A914_9PSEU